MKRMPWFYVIPLLLFSIYVYAHPHDDEFTILVLTGSLTKVTDQALELDAIDPETRTMRNFLIFVDARTKFRKGKLNITPSDLSPGQRVVSTVERASTNGRIRHVALEIRLDEDKKR